MTKKHVKKKKQSSKLKNKTHKSKAKGGAKGIAWYLQLGLYIFNFFKSLFISIKGM